MREEKISFKEFLYETFLLIVGCLLIALSFVLFFDPHSIAPGGLTGLAVIINYLFNIPLWFVNLIFNVPLFILAYKVLTKRECLKTLLGIVFFYFSVKFIRKFCKFPNYQRRLIINSYWWSNFRIRAWCNI